tara:strand:- start:629 stop:1813 length:1185 start_codon:yes stop_codon:yes gene_type:complete
MQPWQSVLLIISTLLIFGAGFYYDQIEKNTAIAYEESIMSAPVQTDAPIDNNSSTKTNKREELQNSSAWAESKFIIEVPIEKSGLLGLHKEAIKGNTFLTSVLNTLHANPTAKEMIFSPFLNDVFIEPEPEIMRSLFSVSQNVETSNQLFVIVRGHSGKASQLLLRVIFENYKREIQKESTDKPLLPELVNQKKEILMLQKNYLQLAEQIHEENQGSSSQSIEEIALKSELMQIKTELNSHVEALTGIEKIYLDKNKYSEFLTIHSLANYGNIQEFIDNIDQLKRMLANQKLEAILIKEVTKNLTKLESSLDQELAMGIEHIKNLSKSALAKKIELQKKIVDLEMKKNDIHSLHPRFKLLKSVKKELDQKNSAFSSDFQKWQLAKQGLSFKKAS